MPFKGKAGKTSKVDSAPGRSFIKPIKLINRQLTKSFLNINRAFAHAQRSENVFLQVNQLAIPRPNFCGFYHKRGWVRGINACLDCHQSIKIGAGSGIPVDLLKKDI